MNKEEKYKKRLRRAYNLAASTDDRSDVDCLIDECINIILEIEEKHF